jgi:hypothetical protein
MQCARAGVAESGVYKGGCQTALHTKAPVMLLLAFDTLNSKPASSTITLPSQESNICAGPGKVPQQLPILHNRCAGQHG